MDYKNNAGTTQLKLEKRSIIIYKELIAALSEVKFTESGSTREERVYTFYDSGKTSTDSCESRVAFAVRNGILISMSENHKRVTVRFPLVNKRYCTVSLLMSWLRPTTQKISSFYYQLDQILRAILNADKIVLLEDSWVGQSHYTWPRVLGKFRTEKAYTNGHLLLSICREHYFKYKSTRTLGFTQNPNIGTIKLQGRRRIRKDKMPIRKPATNMIKINNHGWPAGFAKGQVSWNSSRYCKRKVERLIVYKVLFTNPSARAGYDTRSIFKRSLTGFNSEFSFS